MNLHGKVYICSQCQTHRTIEYEGGMRLTQVGEGTLLSQQSLLQQYGDELSRLLGGLSTHVLYDLALCCACAEKIQATTAATLSAEERNALVHCVGAATEFVGKWRAYWSSATASRVESFLSDLSLELCAAIAPAAYASTIGQKFFKLKNKRRTLISSFLDLSRDALQATLVTEVAKSADAQAALAAQVRELASIGPTIRDLLRCCGDTVLEPIDMTAPENLNQHICHDTTIRVPVRGEEGCTDFFRVLTVDKEAIAALLQEAESVGPEVDQVAVRASVEAVLWALTDA